MSATEENVPTCDTNTNDPKRKQQNRANRLITFVRAAGVVLAILIPALGAQAQNVVACPPTNQDLLRIPELVSQNGKLRGTVLVSSEQQRIAFRSPASAPSATSTTQCFPQWVRTIRGVDAMPAAPAKSGSYGDPLPGPTLRARVGDLIELTLLNQIDVGNFPYSMDRGEMSPTGGCDETSGVYPGTDPKGDKYPDCFHGSSTANIHFHGTHTNPNTTGDNVFIEVRPSLRTKDEANKPLVTAETVRKPFADFFSKCEQQLKPDQPLRQWPFTWGDLPADWTATQEKLLKQYDDNPRVGRKLWPINKRQLAQGAWPQYYLGAYPYCYRVPEYTDSSWPPAKVADAHSAHAGGAGTAELPDSEPARPLMMGQSPGTHWYHAHKHGSTAIDVANGMTGAFIIEGKYDDDLNQYYGAGWTRKQPVIVINQLGVSPNLTRGGGGAGQGPDKGADFSVNGRLMPVIQMHPGEVQMWRIVNSSGRAGAFFNAPAAGTFQWMQLAQDGVQFANSNYQSSLNQPFLLAAGNRADMLVKAPMTPGMVAVLVQNEVDPRDLPTAFKMTLLSINVSGAPASGPTANFIPSAPSFPPFLADITAAEVKGTKKIEFSTVGNPGNVAQPPAHMIDGKKFDGEIGEVVLLNTVEEWKVSSATYATISHPIHIHIFQVIEVFDPNQKIAGTTTPVYVFDKAALTVPGQCYLDPLGPSDDWKPCPPATPQPPQKNLIWWDVFPIPSGVKATDAAGKPILDPKTGTQVGVPGYFKMRSRFVDYSGYYVIHCHILAHEDRGMMTIVEVAPMRSPYSHH
ncbi:MAG: multicopper oxidase domain-containing protein [Acidobacteriota bacterium]